MLIGKITDIEIKSTLVYDKWYNSLKDKGLKLKISQRLTRMLSGNFGDYKSVGYNIFELRFMSHGGIRIYYTFKHNVMVLLLCGGDKSTQKEDIKKARKMAEVVGC